MRVGFGYYPVLGITGFGYCQLSRSKTRWRASVAVVRGPYHRFDLFAGPFENAFRHLPRQQMRGLRRTAWPNNFLALMSRSDDQFRFNKESTSFAVDSAR